MGTKWTIIPFVIAIIGWFYYQTLPGSSGFARDNSAPRGFTFVSFPKFPCNDAKQPVGECLVQELANVSLPDYASTSAILIYGNPDSIQRLINKNPDTKDFPPNLFAFRATLQAGTGDMEGAIDSIGNIPKEGFYIESSYWPQNFIVRNLLKADKLDSAVKFIRATENISFAASGIEKEKLTRGSSVAWSPVLAIACKLKRQGREEEARAFINETPATSVFYSSLGNDKGSAFLEKECQEPAVRKSTVDLNDEDALIKRIRLSSRDTQSRIAQEALAEMIRNRSKNLKLSFLLWPYALDSCLKYQMCALSEAPSCHLHSYDECLNRLVAQATR